MGCSSIGSHTHADAGYKLIAMMTIKGARAWRVFLTDKFKQRPANIQMGIAHLTGARARFGQDRFSL